MKFFVFLCIVTSAAAFKEGPLLPGITFPEDSNERIVGGWPAATGQFPHQALLSMWNDFGGSLFCGGSLISTRWVATSAFCVFRWTQADVYLGDAHYPSSPVKITTRGLYAHPNYIQSNFNNDIGLIDLQQEVQITANIQPIRIENQVSNTYAGRIALLSGFGYRGNSGPATTSMYFVNMTVITNAKCIETFGDQVVLPSTICAVGLPTGSEGPCHGDSGAPLILQDAKPDILIGLTSFGVYGMCDVKYPYGFTRPNQFIPWIHEVTGINFN